MKNDFRYILDKGSNKFRCPNCGKKRFVLYVDTQNDDEYLPSQYGRCDRENNCQYHLSPYDDGYHKEQWKKENSWMKSMKQKRQNPKSKSANYINNDIFNRSRQGYEQNYFVEYLLSIFDESTVSDLIGKYHIGTSKHWPGSTVFWQIDDLGRIRTGKIMQYNSESGRRVKEPRNRITWVHSVLKLEDFNLKQCLFGLHLINQSDKKIAIVESEKTAIIASSYFPQFIWMATGSKDNINTRILHPLRKRAVILFPDIGAYKKWKEKTSDFKNIIVSDLLEKCADSNARHEGYDLADYLIQYDPVSIKNNFDVSETKFDPDLNEKGYPKSWDDIESIDTTNEQVEKINDDSNFKELKRRDPIIQQLDELFDCKVESGSIDLK